MIIGRFVKVPILITLSNMLNNQSLMLSDEDKDKLAVVLEIESFVSVNEIEDIEVGKSVEITYKTIPDNASLPAMRIISSDANVINVYGNILRASSVGRVTIGFYKVDEMFPFDKKEVTAYRDNFVQKIELALSEKEMGIGRKQNVTATLIPEDAEDANQVSWTVNDVSVADITEEGKIVTKGAGKVIVTAETTKARQSIELEVLPNVTEITISESNVELFVGQTNPIRAKVAPANCFNSNYEWKSSDKSVAVVDKLDDGTEVIRATGIGECIISCVAVEGNCQTRCKVTVESTFKKRENIHSMLSVTAVCMVVALFCTAFNFKMGTTTAAIATSVFGVMAIFKNKADRLWAVILIVVTVVAVFW